MTSFFHSQVAAAAGIIADVAGESVEYVRGSGSDAVAVAIAGAVHSEQGYELTGEGGISLTHESDDWLILVADLVLDGEPAVPAAGDQIRQTVGDTVIVYTVMPIPGKNCFERVGGGCRYRIHTKQTGEEEKPVDGGSE